MMATLDELISAVRVLARCSLALDGTLLDTILDTFCDEPEVVAARAVIAGVLAE